MEKYYQFCQSCELPLTKDNGGGGTNADGATSTRYCSKCYQAGAFTHPEITTAAQMRSFVQERMKERGFPAPLAWFLSLNVPHLGRWKTK